MKKEDLLQKGVKAHFTGQETVFSVESLNEHFEGLKYHEIDVLDIEIDKVVEEGAEPEKESVKFLKESDVDFSLSTPKEVIVREYEKEPISEKASAITEERVMQIGYKKESPEPELPLEEKGMTYEEAEKLLETGKLISLPEWEGFWFGNIKTGETLVLTKEGEILNTPNPEFKERNDWKEVDATPEQQKLLDYYFAIGEDKIINEIETVVTKDIPEEDPKPVVEYPVAKAKKPKIQ